MTLYRNIPGRLLVTTVNGLNSDGTAYDELYTFGGRSFSIRRADTMALVYDSGDELGRKSATLMPELFNSDGEAEFTLAETFDTRSDDKVKLDSLFISLSFKFYYKLKRNSLGMNFVK